MKKEETQKQIELVKDKTFKFDNFILKCLEWSNEKTVPERCSKCWFSCNSCSKINCKGNLYAVLLGRITPNGSSLQIGNRIYTPKYIQKEVATAEDCRQCSLRAINCRAACFGFGPNVVLHYSGVVAGDSVGSVLVDAIKRQYKEPDILPEHICCKTDNPETKGFDEKWEERWFDIFKTLFFMPNSFTFKERIHKCCLMADEVINGCITYLKDKNNGGAKNE